MTIDGREVGGKSSSSYELSSFARDRSAGPQVRQTPFNAIKEHLNFQIFRKIGLTSFYYGFNDHHTNIFISKYGISNCYYDSHGLHSVIDYKFFGFMCRYHLQLCTFVRGK